MSIDKGSRGCNESIDTNIVMIDCVKLFLIFPKHIKRYTKFTDMKCNGILVIIYTAIQSWNYHSF